MYALLIWLLCGFVCMTMAAEKRRNVLFWGVLGFTLGFFAVAALFFVPKLPV